MSVWPETCVTPFLAISMHVEEDFIFAKKTYKQNYSYTYLIGRATPQRRDLDSRLAVVTLAAKCADSNWRQAGVTVQRTSAVENCACWETPVEVSASVRKLPLPVIIGRSCCYCSRHVNETTKYYFMFNASLLFNGYPGWVDEKKTKQKLKY